MERGEILRWLREPDQRRLQPLWRQADAVRKARVGDAVYLRAVVEISNFCVRHCEYCGWRAPNRQIVRYRMSQAEILACARQAASCGCGSITLQAGEDPEITPDWMAGLIRQIRSATPLTVGLSLGEVDREPLRAWRMAGAERYLLRFETSNPALYQRIHPQRVGQTTDRLKILGCLRALGYQVGSGVMVGIPGQTYEDLANDIELFGLLDLDWIGVSPYEPHPDTPLGQAAAAGQATGNGSYHSSSLGSASESQVPNTDLMTYKVIALARLVCPRASISSTTPLAHSSRNGHELGLMRGANVIVPDLTPAHYRAKSEVGGHAVGPGQSAARLHALLRRQIVGLGRVVGTEPGRGGNLYRRGQAGGPAGWGDYRYLF